MDNYQQIIEYLESLTTISHLSSQLTSHIEDIEILESLLNGEKDNYIEEDDNEYVTYSLKHDLKKGTNVIKLKHKNKFIKVNIEIKKNKIFIPYEQNGEIITKDIVDKISSILYEELNL